MLSRTANNLYWLARSVERMEYVARLIDTAQRMAATGGATRASEWHSAIIASGCEKGFLDKHDHASRDRVVNYMVLDTDNPSSILACMHAARRNARAVRSAITADMWEAINSSWIETQDWDNDVISEDTLSDTLDWVKQRALIFQGAYRTTMLRTDAFHFTELGTHIERADNTARILDVKYHVLLPNHGHVGGAIDYVQWTAILRAVSARRAYHHVFKEDIAPWRVAELLILRPELPRSLRACFERVTETLNDLETTYFGRSGAPHQKAASMNATLRYSTIEQIFQSGLHEFLTEFIDNTTELGKHVSEFYYM